MEKECTKCLIYKRKDEFAENRNVCKICRKEQKRINFYRNHEYRLEQARSWKKNNKDRNKLITKTVKIKNKEKYRIINNLRRSKNVDKYNELNRIHRYIRNKYKNKLYIVYEKFSNRCFKCRSKTDLVIDHHFPINLGYIEYGDNLDNAVVLCKTCNGSKSNRKPYDFYSKKELIILEKLGIKNMRYKDELYRAMTWLGEQSNTIFLGQSVEYPGTGMFDTLSGVSIEKKKEMPVAENMQMGISTGLALNGFVPISIFPRWNFLILAADQIVNHLDKLKAMSNGGYRPKVIIRVGVGSQHPLDPQDQHKSNFSSSFRNMLTNIDVIELHEPEDIFPVYKMAYERTDGKSTIISEFSDYLNLK